MPNSATPTHIITGMTAETAVCEHLSSQGYTILDRNWRRPWGELDIVAKKEGTLHFVEVKAARRRDPGFEPFLRADGWKMHKVQRTAETWLATNQYPDDTPWQLDIASVILGKTEPDIEFFENI